MANPERKAVDLAWGILTEKLDPIEGCRLLASLQHELGLADDINFLVFVAVASDADEWPPADVRSRFSGKMLARVDLEMAEYLGQMRPSILAACSELIRTLESAEDRRG